MTRDIRKGMWCVDEEGRVGIACMDDVFEKNGQVQRKPDGSKVQEPTFHVCDEQGATTLVTYRPWDGLTQAKYEEIPAARRPESRDAAARLGYV